MSCEKKRRKSWIHKKTAKLLRVMSKENEISKETKSTQPSESIPETTVRSSAQQKFPWHVECEVETTEKGHNRGARSCSQPPTLDGLMLEKTGKKAQMYVRQNLMWFTVHEILTKRVGVNGVDGFYATEQHEFSRNVDRIFGRRRRGRIEKKIWKKSGSGPIRSDPIRSPYKKPKTWL